MTAHRERLSGDLASRAQVQNDVNRDPLCAARRERLKTSSRWVTTTISAETRMC